MPERRAMSDDLSAESLIDGSKILHRLSSVHKVKRFLGGQHGARPLDILIAHTVECAQEGSLTSNAPDSPHASALNVQLQAWNSLLDQVCC